MNSDLMHLARKYSTPLAVVAAMFITGVFLMPIFEMLTHALIGIVTFGRITGRLATVLLWPINFAASIYMVMKLYPHLRKEFLKRTEPQRW